MLFVQPFLHDNSLSYSHFAFILSSSLFIVYCPIKSCDKSCLELVEQTIWTWKLWGVKNDKS